MRGSNSKPMCEREERDGLVAQGIPRRHPKYSVDVSKNGGGFSEPVAASKSLPVRRHETHIAGEPGRDGRRHFVVDRASRCGNCFGTDEAEFFATGTSDGAVPVIRRSSRAPVRTPSRGPGGRRT